MEDNYAISGKARSSALLTIRPDTSFFERVEAPRREMASYAETVKWQQGNGGRSPYALSWNGQGHQGVFSLVEGP